MSASLACKMVALFSGVIVQRYILVAFGSTYNGLTSLISQIMSYLVLLEAGLGAASIQAFYAPLNGDDWNSVSGIMNATSASYTKIGISFGALLLGGSLLVPLAATGEVEFFVAGLLTLVTGAGNIFTYIIGGKNVALLSADRKMYVIYSVDTVSTIMSATLRIIALKCGVGIVLVQSIQLLCVLLKNVFLSLYVKRCYKNLDKSVPANFAAISKRWNVLVHSIAGLVVNHTDVIILTVAASLKLVSVYNVYNMIYGQMGNVIQSTFMQAPQAEFGRALAKGKKEFEQLYAKYETLFSIFLFIVITVALVLTRPFVALYTAGVTDVEYIDSWLPILFAAILLMSQVRAPAIITVNATGTFKETQRGAIIEAVINITVSLLLFFATDLGMYGLLLGTVCSYLYRTVDVIYYVYRNVIERSIWRFLKVFLVNFGCSALMWYLFCVRYPVNASSYLEWIGVAILCGIMVLLFFALTNILFNFKDINSALGGSVSKILKKLKK